jgi:hypothetical protein
MEGTPQGDIFPAHVARLARFNSEQLRDIERALAELLAVDTTYVTPDGFSVTRESDETVGIHWRGTARLDIATFNRIVNEATAGDETATDRWRDHMPEPRGALARPRHFVRRKRRREEKN